jgi:hypothetical protein
MHSPFVVAAARSLVPGMQAPVAGGAVAHVPLKQRGTLMREQIEEGFLVFATDGAEGIGSVREIHPERDELVVYVENAGDFTIPLASVDTVHSQKVMLRCEQLEPRIREAISHAHDAEDPRYMSGAPFRGSYDSVSNDSRASGNGADEEE